VCTRCECASPAAVGRRSPRRPLAEEPQSTATMPAASRSSMSASVAVRNAFAVVAHSRHRWVADLDAGGTGHFGDGELRVRLVLLELVELDEQAFDALGKQCAHPGFVAVFVFALRRRAGDCFLGSNAAESRRASPARLRWCMYFMVVCTSEWPIHAWTWTIVAWLIAIEPNV